MNFAPVLISVYDRLNHLQQCVASLKKNKEAAYTDLFIAVDYPANERDEPKIDKVIDYCEKIDGFKSVNIIRRTENLGAGNNMRTARLELFEMYERLITMEDDNIVAPNFLEYVNGALEFYDDDERIVTVSGFNFPMRMPENYDKDVYVWPAVNGYGVGWWRKKFSLDYFELKDFEDFIFDDKAIASFLNVAEHILPIMLDGIARGILQGDAVKSYNYFRRGKFNLYPVVSKVRNIGYDGSGVNCNTDERFVRQKIDDGARKTKFVKNILPDEKVYEALREYFRIDDFTKKQLAQTITFFRKKISEGKKERPYSPLTNTQNVRKIREIPVSLIVSLYGVYNIDVRKYFKGLDAVDIYKCNQSGFEFYYPLNLAGDGEFYEQLQNIPWYYMDEKWEFDVALEFIKPKEKVLEIGSGKGAFLRKAKEKGVEVFGSELNREQAEALREEGFTIFDENFKTFSEHKENFFDVVCSFQVLEHVANPKEFIEYSLKTLRKGGRLIISVPNHDSFMGLDDENFLDMPPHHMGLWNEQSLVSLEKFFPMKLREIRFETLQSYHIDYYKSVFEKKYEDEFSLKEKIFDYIEKFPNKIKGFTILAVYEKE